MLDLRHYQNAYVTRDIVAAAARLGAALDRPVQPFEVDFDLAIPGARGRLKLALVWAQGLQYELIEPVGGAVDVWRDALPEGDGLRFHHVALEVPAWEPFREAVARGGEPVVIEGGGDSLRFLYVDRRALLGHFVEYVWATPERWATVRAGGGERA